MWATTHRELEEGRDLMADTAVETAAHSAIYDFRALGGPYYSSATDAALIFVAVAPNYQDLSARVTDDAGATWGSQIIAAAGTAVGVNTWFEPATPGLTNDLVHCSWIDITGTSGGTILYYANFDISAATWSTPVAIISTLTNSPTNRNHRSSITVSRDGNIYIGYVISTGTPSSAFYRSTNGGTSFDAARASPFESNALDMVYLFPANTADDADVAAVFFDRNVTTYTIKMYDDSANSWTESAGWSITGFDSNAQPGDHGSVRHSDGKIIFASHEQANNAVDDLHVKEISVTSISSPTVSSLTDIYTNTVGVQQAAVTINQQNDDIYVAYLRGTWQSAMQAYYDVSTDDGVTWAGEAAYGQDTAGDLRLIMGPTSIGSAGGVVQFSFFNDDLNDIFINLVNDIPISAAGGAFAARLALLGVG